MIRISVIQLVKVAILFLVVTNKGYSQDLLHSSYQYNMSVFLQDSVHRAEYKALKRELHRIRYFTLEDKQPFSFRLKFHNLTESPSSRFSSDVSEQVASLNRDFNMENSSISTSHEYFDLVDTARVSFELTDTEISSAEFKWTDWNSFKHSESNGRNPEPNLIHIWVVDLPDTIQSYASNPNGDKDFEGIVLDISKFGSTADPNYNKGKTLTFLMGIYLGLEPLYGTHSCDEDGVVDTPRHHEIASCNSSTTKCSNQKSMFDNFMAQSYDNCKKYFTKGQIQRMKYCIRNSFTLTNKIAK